MFAVLKLYCFFVYFICFICQGTHADTGAADVILQDPLSIKSENQEESGFNLNDAEMSKFHIWPSGVIPYFIDDFSFDKGLRDNIRYYLDSVNTVTGLKFIEIPRPPEDDRSRWVFFVNRIGQLGCADVSFNQFTNEGVQRVVLGYDCLSSGGLAEVILALVGVPPQHNSPDRDENIEINKNNILPDKLNLFNILKDDEWLFHDLPYDLLSAGHYSSHRYTSNGGDTISIREIGDVGNDKEKVNKLKIKLGKFHKGLSKIDVTKIQMLYNYISGNREGQIDVPGCNKLFSRGPNYNNYKPDISSDIKPRPKPQKYLQMTGEKYNEVGGGLKNYRDGNKENNFSDIIEPLEKNVKLLKHSINQKQSQILGESDYRTGDEGR